VGEYFYVINIDKKEYIDIPPSKYGEQIASAAVPVALFWLLTKKKDSSYPTLGRWAGDRVVVIGDSDMEYEWVAEEMIEGKFRDITIEVCMDLAKWCREHDIYLDEFFEGVAKRRIRLKKIQSEINNCSDI